MNCPSNFENGPRVSTDLGSFDVSTLFNSLLRPTTTKNSLWKARWFQPALSAARSGGGQLSELSVIHHETHRQSPNTVYFHNIDDTKSLVASTLKREWFELCLFSCSTGTGRIEGWRSSPIRRWGRQSESSVDRSCPLRWCWCWWWRLTLTLKTHNLEWFHVSNYTSGISIE